MAKPCVVIAGASQGLGRSVAWEALRLGHSVALIARNDGLLKELAASLKTEAQSDQIVSAHTCDLSKVDEVQAAFTEIKDAHTLLKTLVNCAGTWTGGVSALELSASGLRESMDLNFFAAYLPIEQMLAAHKDNATHDISIINCGATASLRGGARMAPFAVAKSSLRILSQSLAKELAPQGVHVAHVVIDGLINNERTRKLNPTLSEDKFIDPGAIAKDILHVASQDRSCWTFEWDVRPFNEKW